MRRSPARAAAVLSNGLTRLFRRTRESLVLRVHVFALAEGGEAVSCEFIMEFIAYSERWRAGAPSAPYV